MGKETNKVDIGENANVAESAIAVGHQARAEQTTTTGSATRSAPRTPDELRAAVDELIVRIRAAENTLTDREQALADAEELRHELTLTPPSRVRLKRTATSLRDAVGGATALSGAIALLIQAINTLFPS
ncbi:hypothetical protein [Embleya hyalina]|uniref:Uncharacterized protein n=1 Tax=Embleya hyalina TaxID=516124 RepID=A0A401Z6Q1_9ACTN|nr:hypothetical protein [Embleya hyalina]GCE02519.1 hypothetical protein EHYA_10296 [Embleya hyalina]